MRLKLDFLAVEIKLGFRQGVKKTRGWEGHAMKKGFLTRNIQAWCGELGLGWETMETYIFTKDLR